MDEVDPSRGLLITAQGLLMYFDFDDVERLVAACAAPVPRRHARVRRDAGLAQQGEPAGQARRPGPLPAAAVAVGHGPRQAPPARRRTSYGSRAGAGSSSATSPRCSGSASSQIYRVRL